MEALRTEILMTERLVNSAVEAFLVQISTTVAKSLAYLLFMAGSLSNATTQVPPNNAIVLKRVSIVELHTEETALENKDASEDENDDEDEDEGQDEQDDEDAGEEEEEEDGDERDPVDEPEANGDGGSGEGEDEDEDEDEDDEEKAEEEEEEDEEDEEIPQPPAKKRK